MNNSETVNGVSRDSRGGFQILPFYLVCDTSTSMRGEQIKVVNSELPLIHQTIALDPIVNDKCRISIITFDTVAKIALPLQRLADVKQMPSLTAGGRTNYGVLFRELPSIIRNDLQELRNSGFATLRPIVFFISDGGATDSWIQVFDDFIDRTKNPQAPVMISFGVGTAKESAIIRVGKDRAMMANKTESVPAALRSVLKSLTSSIVGSSRSSEAGIVLPESDQNIRIVGSSDRR